MPNIVECRYCQQDIWFDWNCQPGSHGKKNDGSLLPLEVDGDGRFLTQRHDCPKSPWRQKQQQTQQQEQQQGEQQQAASKMSPQQLDTALSDINWKLEKLLQNYGNLLEQFRKAYMKEQSLLEADRAAASAKEDGTV